MMESDGKRKRERERGWKRRRNVLRSEAEDAVLRAPRMLEKSRSCITT